MILRKVGIYKKKNYESNNRKFQSYQQTNEKKEERKKKEKRCFLFEKTFPKTFFEKISFFRKLFE